MMARAWRTRRPYDPRSSPTRRPSTVVHRPPAGVRLSRGARQPSRKSAKRMQFCVAEELCN